MSGPATPTKVVFDLGGVLIDWDPRGIFQQHFATRGVMEEFMTQHFWRVHHECHDSDASFADTIEPHKLAHPEYAAAFDAMAHHWQHALIGPIPETVSVLNDLVGRGVPLYALTNWPAQTWPPVHPDPQDYGFLSHFKDIVVSGQVQLRKPDDAIYTLAMQRFALAPGEAVFIDDLAVNAEAATRAGMVGHQFLSAAHLRSRLEGWGLL